MEKTKELPKIGEKVKAFHEKLGRIVEGTVTEIWPNGLIIMDLDENGIRTIFFPEDLR